MVHRSTLVALVFALSTIAVVGCAQAPAGLTDADRAAIRQVEADSVKFANAKDWPGWTSHFTSDGSMSPPNGPIVMGQEQILAWAKAFPPMSDFSIDLVEIEGHATMAYGRGTYKLKIMPPGASEAVQDSGKFIEIWMKQADGSWKVKRDIFNSDLPLPPMPPPPPPPAPAKK